MKRKYALIIGLTAVFALCACMLAGCGEDSSTTGEEATEQAATGTTDGEGFTLTVGFDAEYSPYGFMDDDGNYVGFDLDLAAKVAERNGWGLELLPIDWDTKDAQLESGTINCIWNGFTYEGREDDYSWSEPYMINAQVIVVPADSDISDNEDLAGKTVMTQADSAALELLQDDEKDLADTFAGGGVKTKGDYNSIFMELEQGSIDAVACDLSIALYQQSAKPDAYTILEPYLSSEHYAVGFAKGNDDLANTVTESLKALDEEGVVETLCNEYSDYGLSYTNWILK